MDRLAHLAVVLILPAAGALAAVQAVTHACTIDGQPTAVANGRRTVPSQNPPTLATVRVLAPFSFPGAYQARTVIPLTEDRTQLRAVLPPKRWSGRGGGHSGMGRTRSGGAWSTAMAGPVATASLCRRTIPPGTAMLPSTLCASSSHADQRGRDPALSSAGHRDGTCCARGVESLHWSQLAAIVR
jgi:hypothetical protein